METVASLYRSAALTIGVPAAVGVIVFGVTAVVGRVGGSPTSACKADALTNVILSIGAGIGFVFRIFAWFGQMLFAILAAVCLLIALLALGLWSISGGLQNGSAWAPFAAVVILAPVLVVAMGSALSRGRFLRRVLSLGIAAGVAILLAATFEPAVLAYFR